MSWRPDDDTAGPGHVPERIVDVLEDGLTGEEHAKVEDHLRRCPECAADLALARSLREEGIRRGTRHLGPERILTLATDPGTAGTPEERAHLAACASCREEIALESAMPPMPSSDGAFDVPQRGIPRTTARSSSKAVLGGWRWVVWAGAAAGVTAALVFSTHVGRESEEVAHLRALARIEALPAEISRSTPEPGSFDEIFGQAVEHYADRDYPEAEKLFERACAVGPDRAEAQLYLGSARLLRGRYDGATQSLGRAVQLAGGTGPLAEEARWQLANALLAAGRRKEAEESLRAVVTMDSVHASAAGEGLSRLAHLAH